MTFYKALGGTFSKMETIIQENLYMEKDKVKGN
jgi:hypothetical protein